MATFTCQPPTSQFPPSLRSVDQIRFYQGPPAARARKACSQQQKPIMGMQTAISGRAVKQAQPIRHDSDSETSPCADGYESSSSRKWSSQDPIDINDDDESLKDSNDELPTLQQLRDQASSAPHKHIGIQEREGDDFEMEGHDVSMQDTTFLEQSCVESNIDEPAGTAEVEERSIKMFQESFTIDGAIDNGLTVDQLSVPQTIPETPTLPLTLDSYSANSMVKELSSAVDKDLQDQQELRQEQGTQHTSYSKQTTKHCKRKDLPKAKRGRPPKRLKAQARWTTEEHTDGEYQPSDPEIENLEQHSSVSHIPATAATNTAKIFRQQVRKDYLTQYPTLDKVSNGTSSATAHIACDEWASGNEMSTDSGIKIDAWTCQRNSSSVSISAVMQASGQAEAALRSIEEAMTEIASMFDIGYFDQIIFSRSSTGPQTWLVSGFQRLKNGGEEQTTASLTNEVISEKVTCQQAKHSNKSKGSHNLCYERKAARSQSKYPEWSADQDAKLKEWKGKGEDWKQIAKKLERTEGAVKVRWYTKIQER